MKVTERVSIDHEDRDKLFKFIESHGSVSMDRLRDEVFPHDDERLVHHLAILKRDGYVDVDGDDVSLKLEMDADEEVHSSDGVEFVIRSARQEDISGVIGTIQKVAGEGSYIEAESVASVLSSEQSLIRHNELETRLFLVALVDDEVVGWAHIEHPEHEKLAHTAALTFGVLEDYRGHGIGGRLFDKAVELASEYGYEKLYQSVPSSNESGIEFLESKGCEVDAVRENHYKIDEEYVDEVMMALYI